MPAEIYPSLLIFARFFACFFLSPFLSTFGVPFSLRLLLAVGLAVFLTPFVAKPPLHLLEQSIFFLLLKELAIGAFLGWFFSLIIEAASLYGHISSLATGFSARELFYPQSVHDHLLSFAMKSFALTLLFTMNGMHLFIWVVYKSFTAFPLSFPLLTSSWIEATLQALQLFFQLALNFSGFLLILFFLVFILQGIFTRFIPEIPIYWISIPFQIFVGTVALWISVQWFPLFIEMALQKLSFFVGKYLFAT